MLPPSVMLGFDAPTSQNDYHLMVRQRREQSPRPTMGVTAKQKFDKKGAASPFGETAPIVLN